MICVVDYGMGNLRSVSKALERLGAMVTVSSQPEDVKKAEKVVLPGVGAFGEGCAQLLKRGLFNPILDGLSQNKPFLGICLGMQLLFEESEESPGAEGLSFFKGGVQRFRTKGLKIPHMGWNELRMLSSMSPAFRSVANGSFFYFVHSYYVVPKDQSLILGTCEYEGEEFPAFIGQGSVWASQFHPEKSQEAGLKILRNFIDGNLSCH